MEPEPSQSEVTTESEVSVEELGELESTEMELVFA
jgi:hypothetical protein